jgi:NTE family protein
MPDTNRILVDPDALTPDDVSAGAGPEDGTALCLSGGGYRAMLFHVGTLWALNDHGWLPKLDRISSVSGGSITAGVLGLAWPDLGFDTKGIAANFRTKLVQPIRGMAGKTIDVKSILSGLFGRGSIGDAVSRTYNRELFHGATLQNLPDKPRFVINATNVQSTALFRFSRPYIWDYRVGKIERPEVLLADAVAASSSFPPVLSPLTLDLSKYTFVPGSGKDLQKPPYTTKAILTDGGVYDNMGIETAWKRYKRVLVSDAGGKTAAEDDPPHDWARHALRINDLIDNQVRSLRKRDVIDSFGKTHEGAYWSVRSDITKYAVNGALPCPLDRALALAAVPTRLQEVSANLQERLINWGYAITDAAMRKHVDPNLTAPADFPYPAAKI